MGKGKTRTFTEEQLLDENLKNIEGESNIEVKERMQGFFQELIQKEEKQNIAIVSHGASIKFFLQQFCELSENLELLYNDSVLQIHSPSVIKLEIQNGKIHNIIQIY